MTLFHRVVRLFCETEFCFGIKIKLALSVHRPRGSVYWGEEKRASIPHGQQIAGEFCLGTKDQNPRTKEPPWLVSHFEICARCGHRRSHLVVRGVCLSARPKVNISERYFQRSPQPSKCRVTSGCFLASANFTSSDCHSLSYKLSYNILNLPAHFIFFFKCFSSL